MQGWISLHRKIRTSPIFNDHQLFRLWIICLTEATHKERDQMIGKQTIKLKPGEFVTGRFHLLDMYNNGLKPSDKIKGEKTVFRWLEILQKGGYLTIKKTNKYSLVSIDNWAFYQDANRDNADEMTNKRPSNDHQMTTNNNGNNVNKNIISSSATENFAEIMDFYSNNLQKGITETPYNYELISQWFEEFGFDLLLAAMKVAAKAEAKGVKMIEGVLKNWKEAGVNTLEDARKYETEFKKTKVKTGGHKKQNGVNWDELGRTLEDE